LKPEKRGKIQIYSDILEAFYKNVNGNELSLTRISHTTNLPYDRFKKYLDELVQLGMVSRQNENLAVTEKGLEYVEWNRKTATFLRRMGLVP
jgi:predicted transcriptional regulator